MRALQEIGDHIWRAHSDTPGTHLILLGGVHGNESIGIEVVTSLKEELASGTLSLASGTLTLVLANPRAMHAKERWVHGRDLNRYFSKEHIEHQPEGSWEEARAKEIAGYAQEADILLDIHSTNKPSLPFACSRITPAHRRVYQWFDLTHVIEDPEYIFGDEPVTTDEYMDSIGKTGVCIETGWIEDPGRMDATKKSVCAVLSEHGLLSEPPPSLPTQKPHEWTFVTKVVMDERGFRFADGKGLASFEPIQRGEVLGYRGEEPVTMDQDGVIVFPKLQEHFQVGNPVCWIAVKKEA